MRLPSPMQPANEATLLGDFDAGRFEHQGVVTRFSRREGTYFVHTDGPDGRLAEFRVAYVFGVFPLQQYLVELPGGRLQALSVAWDSRTRQSGGQRFFHLYPKERIDYHDVLHGRNPRRTGTRSYSGGLKQNPTYENHEGHVEAVQVTFDPAVVSFRKLVDYHLRHIDPLDDGGQFCDRGHSYTTAIFAVNAEEWSSAKESIAEAEKILGRKIVTPISDRGDFWLAEGYHQDYYKKNPLRYKYYRSACGSDSRVKKVWGDHGALTGGRRGASSFRDSSKINTTAPAAADITISWPLSDPNLKERAHRINRHCQRHHARRVLTWYRANHPVWFRWLDIA